MKKVKGIKLYKLKEHKIVVLGIIFLVLLTVIIAIPTLANYKNRNLSQTIAVWDGTISDSYRSGDGSKENPYIIANGQELAYFASQLSLTNYEGKYFKLSNDIVLNKGIFSYKKDEGIKYTNDTDENIIIPNLENNLINKFSHLNNFKGTFDGNYYKIFGIYIDKILPDGQNALFTNLEGNIKNLYIENSIIYGGKITAGVASKTNNATLTNILYDGFVISDEEPTNNVIEKNIEEINLKTEYTETNNNISIPDLEYIPGLITEVKLSGYYETDDTNSILRVNDEIISAGDFEINLGNEISPTIPINYQSYIGSNISITELNYQIKYNYGNAAGIVSVLENTTLQNIINKGNVNASTYSSGIINFINGATIIKNVYNIGKIESNNISSGLISGINHNKKDTTIINCYSDGELYSNNNSMIGNIEYNTGNITLENIFNPQDNYVINLIDESNVLINNSYAVTTKPINLGTSTGEFIQTSKENFEDKTFIQNNLKYEKYNEEENNLDSPWVFHDSSLPKIFLDCSKANIYIGDNKWDTYKNQLKNLNFSKKFVFSIKETNELNNIKEVYYYINNSDINLTKNELNQITTWKKYEDVVEIDKEGIYTIYAKIVSVNDNVSYINTDIIMLDMSGPNITVSSALGDKTWNTIKEDLNTYYIDDATSITINTEDSLSGIKEIYYYTTDKSLTLEEVENIENWNQYIAPILINNKKTVIYAKGIDNCGNVTYINSDIIILNGYTLNSIYPGTTSSSTINNLHITQRSSVTLNFSYIDVTEYKKDNKHQIVSNVLLPENTIITVIDKIKNKVYKYTTTNDRYGYDDCPNNNCQAIYNFELFDEVGTINKFQESSYTGVIKEEFIINIDFKNTKITQDIENISISLNLYNEIDSKKTIQSTLKNFNVNISNDAYFTLNSQFNDTINYSENEKYIIDFNTKLNYKYLGENKVYDTTFEDKKIGLAIKLLYPNGNIVEKQYLKNILFKVGNKKYSPSSDGIVRINLDKGLNDITGNLVIETFKDNSKLETGNYKFEISLFTAYDGIYSNEYLTKIDIPVYVGENTYKNDISFNVEMNNEDKIVSKNINEFNFKFLVNSNISPNSNIKVSLYQKESLSAYNQNYTKLDLGNYLVNNTLEKYDENTYYATKDIPNNSLLNINLNTSLLEKKGYMFVFELYENDKIVSKINKKFIVK